MRLKNLIIFLLMWSIILIFHKNLSHSYTSHFDIKHQKIQILSSSPKIWSKISNNEFYYSYVYRLESKNNFIKILFSDNKFDHIEFYYNTYYKSDQNMPTSFISDINVQIGKDEESLKKLYSNQVAKIGQNKVKLDISKWKSSKKLIIKFIAKNNESIGTEIFGIFPFKAKKYSKRVMLISLDTVGIKHMSLYGYKKFNTTPKLNEIVRKENNIFVFSNAYGQSWWTLPAHASMFSGLYPSQHDMNNGKLKILFNSNIRHLHQIFNEKGIYTYHSISHKRVADEYGYNRGVVLYSNHSKFKDGNKADRTIQNAISVIKENLDKDIFLFLHFFDAHSPYLEYPDNYYELSADIEPIYDHSLTEWNPKDMNNMNGYDPRNRLINKQKSNYEFEKKIKHFERAYDLGLRLLDQKIYKFFKQLKSLNLWDSFDILIVGDHGEEFFEHAGFTHTSLYNDNIKVPLIIKLNKTFNKNLDLYKSKFINTNVEAHIATFWTVLDMFSLKNINHLKVNTKRKCSLLDKSFINRGIFSEFLPDFAAIGSICDSILFYQAALILDDFKLILTTYLKNQYSFQLNNEYFELYNIQKDPEEKYNLIYDRKHIKVAKNLKKKLIKRIKTEWKIRFKAIKKGQLSKEEIEKLRTLGYIKN